MMLLSKKFGRKTKMTKKFWEVAAEVGAKIRPVQGFFSLKKLTKNIKSQQVEGSV
jgi:hypothetical protein